MSKREITNATIESTMLGPEDHNILTCFVMLDYSGSSQGFGGYGLDNPVRVDGEFSHREGTAWGMEFINRILKTVGVRRWEDLPGVNVRVDREPFGRIHGIGHITKDSWFYPEKDLAHLSEKGGE